MYVQWLRKATEYEDVHLVLKQQMMCYGILGK